MGVYELMLDLVLVGAWVRVCRKQCLLGLANSKRRGSLGLSGRGSP